MENHSALQLRIVILVDRPRASAFACGELLWGWEKTLLEEKTRRAGIPASEITYVSISSTTAMPNDADRHRCLAELNRINPVVIVALDEVALRFCTGKSSIWKWHLSPLDALPEFTTRKIIPSFHPDQIRKSPELGFYLELALRRAREESVSREFDRKPHRFLLNPRIEVSFDILESLRKEPVLSIDIETGRGQINTVGFAWSASDAIAINVLPESYGPENYYKLWEAIAALLQGPAKKIYQNALYEIMCFSRYGIRTDVWHDTMLAQKFLFPELEKGLDNVGRLWTREPYWKDIGHETIKKATEDSADEEKAPRKEKKDWGNIRDWSKHYLYNCLDTAGTFEACFNQRKEIEKRDRLSFFDGYLSQLFRPVAEMSLNGLPVDKKIQKELIIEHETLVVSLKEKLSKDINPGSWQQKQKLFEEKGYVLFKKKNSKGKWVKSTDELRLKKLLQKHPDDADIPLLLKIAEYNKALSSYFRVETNPFTGNIHFSMDLHGTETGRFACYSDPWDQGLNAQTLPSYCKKMIALPKDSDLIFIQCDLKQAESRFVAYDTADANLIAALEDPARDIHSEVANEIIKTLGVDVSGLTKEEYKKKWRQLGKKSSHGSNYAMQEDTFMENCLKEMDLVLTKKEAKVILEAYHSLFPGIRRGHKNIERTLWNERKLSNPFGRERHFFGRMDASTFREAYAYRPQSTIPDVTNKLMLALWDQRASGNMKFNFLLQCHDSLTLSANKAEIDLIAKFMLDYKLWQEPIVLAGGSLLIPTSVETGKNLGEMYEYKST